MRPKFDTNKCYVTQEDTDADRMLTTAVKRTLDEIKSFGAMGIDQKNLECMRQLISKFVP